jgi:hypothetical protein
MKANVEDHGTHKVVYVRVDHKRVTAAGNTWDEALEELERKLAK